MRIKEDRVRLTNRQGNLARVLQLRTSDEKTSGFRALDDKHEAVIEYVHAGLQIKPGPFFIVRLSIEIGLLIAVEAQAKTLK